MADYNNNNQKFKAMNITKGKEKEKEKEKKSSSWFGKSKESVGQTDVKPMFTADRALVYILGGLTLTAGGYVIYRVVAKFLNDFENNGTTPKVQTNVASLPAMSPTTGKKSDNVLTIYIPKEREFPINYGGYTPAYSQAVASLQKLLVEKLGDGILPNWGIDGKYGPETQGAVKRYFKTNGLSVSKGEFMALYNEVGLEGLGTIDDTNYYPKKKTSGVSFTNGSNGLSLSSFVKNNALKGLGCASNCGCNHNVN